MFVADIVQQVPHRLVLEDELVLFGVEWQCKDASFKLYDMLYYAVEWADTGESGRRG